MIDYTSTICFVPPLYLSLPLSPLSPSFPSLSLSPPLSLSLSLSPLSPALSLPSLALSFSLSRLPVCQTCKLGTSPVCSGLYISCQQSSRYIHVTPGILIFKTRARSKMHGEDAIINLHFYDYYLLRSSLDLSHQRKSDCAWGSVFQRGK